MPYIPEERRQEIGEELFEHSDTWIPFDAGDLNYITSTFISNYLDVVGVSYANINEMVGALECCKLELYRRLAVLYEDQKMDENGDVYTAVRTMKEDY